MSQDRDKTVQHGSLDKTLEKKLLSAWKKERLYYHGKGWMVLLIGLVSLLLAEFLLDWFLHLSVVWRVVLLVVNAGILGTLYYRFGGRFLRPYDPIRVSLQVEKQYPDLKNILVSGVDFSRETKGRLASFDLEELVKEQAVQQTASLDFGAIIRFRQLRRWAGLCILLLVFVAGLGLAKTEVMKTFLYRMFYLSGSSRYTLETTLSVLSGNQTVKQGSPVTLTASVSGRIPDHCIWHHCY